LSERSSESTELIKLEETLAEKEHKLQALYCQMGKSILEIADGERNTVNTLVDDIYK